MSNEEIRAINAQLNRIEMLTTMTAKTIFNLEEAAMFTGFTAGHLYRLTSGKQIPHYKKNRKLYFKKEELEEWLTEQKVMSESEIARKAMTYTATNR